MAEEFSNNNGFQYTPQTQVAMSGTLEHPIEKPMSETPQSTNIPEQPEMTPQSIAFPHISLQAAELSPITSKSMFKCWTEALTRMFDITGRTSRYEFWAFQSISLVIFLLLALIGYFLSEPKMVLDIFAVYFLFPAASSSTRRMHDISMSGWWTVPAVVLALTTLICWNLGVHNMVLLLFFTLVYVSVLCDFWCRIGDDADNAYGAKVRESEYRNLESRAFISFMTAFIIGLWVIFAAYLVKF
ncbi:MAG: DUF805 domain-containing protein [Alphaproteobacteria bacterium]|nr:DUF805 domain-containing protein [Alphaproteobacteria bacterium]